jgi:hypothetical protein
MIQMGVSALGSFAGGVDYFGAAAKGASTLQKVATAATQVTLQNAVSYAGSGFHIGEDGAIGYKGPSKGSFYSTLVSTAFGAAGAGLGAGYSNTNLGKSVVSTTFNALGSGFQFEDDGSAKAYNWGKAGISFASNMASTVASSP